jgi:hypothetical protein
MWKPNQEIQIQQYNLSISVASSMDFAMAVNPLMYFISISITVLIKVDPTYSIQLGLSIHIDDVVDGIFTPKLFGVINYSFHIR